MTNFETSMHQGALLLNQGKFEASIEAFDRILMQELTSEQAAQVHQQRGIVYRKMDELQKSELSFKLALSCATNDEIRSADVMRDLAMVYLDDGQTLKARDMIVESIDIFSHISYFPTIRQRLDGTAKQAAIGSLLGQSFLARTYIHDDRWQAKAIFRSVRTQLKNLDASPTVQLNNMLALASISRWDLLLLSFQIIKIALKTKRTPVLKSLLKK